MNLIKKLLSRETVLYIVFGVLTTVVNYAVFYLFYHILFHQSMSLLANAIAFAAAVVFSFVVNKLFVFTSRSWAPDVVLREAVTFTTSRLASFGMEEAGLFLCESILHWDELTLTFGPVAVDGVTCAKLALSVLVVIVNYVLCKLFVFKK